MKKNVLFIALALLCGNMLYAQQKITGYVQQASDLQPIPYATAVLYSTDSVFIEGTVSNQEGVFAFATRNEGSYTIHISSVGYISQYKDIVWPADSKKKNVFRLSEQLNELDEVSIVASRPPIVNQGEKLIVNVDSYLKTAGKSSLDVVKLMPGMVSQQDNLNLMGKDVTVYINNKPSNYTGTDLKNYLIALSGDQIDKIELILNPSSKFDADITGAVINIVLKKDTTVGLNGSIANTGAVWGSDMYEIPSVIFNYRNKAINIYGGYTFMFNKYNNRLEYSRELESLSPPIRYDEVGKMGASHRYHSYNFGVDYTLSEKHELGFLFKGTNSDANMPNHTRTEVSTVGINLVDSVILSPIKQERNNYDYQLNLNHRWLIGKGKELITNLNYMKYNSKNNQLIPKYHYHNEETQYSSVNGFGQHVNQDMNLWTLKTDYEQEILSDGVLNAGVKLDVIDRENDILGLEMRNEIWEENTAQSNIFDYDENIYGIYVNAEKPIGSFYFSGGLRWEYTYQRGKELSTNEQFTKRYNDFFPYASAQYNMGERQSLTLAYSRKISRPSFSALNPFKFYTSPQTFQVGNPSLNPSYTNSYSLKILIKKLSLTLQHSNEKGEVQSEAFLDEDSKQLGYRTVNWGKTNTYSFSLYYPIDIFPWWSASLNTTTKYNKIESLINNEPYRKNYCTLVSSLYQEYTITKSLTADLYLVYVSDRWLTATKIKEAGTLEASITKDFWNDRAYVSLGVTDPFRWQTFRSKYAYQNINEKTKEYINTRKVYVSFKYRFGSDKIKKNRSKSTGTEEMKQRID